MTINNEPDPGVGRARTTAILRALPPDTCADELLLIVGCMIESGTETVTDYRAADMLEGIGYPAPNNPHPAADLVSDAHDLLITLPFDFRPTSTTDGAA